MNTFKKPQRINSSEIADRVSQGVHRALAARETCLRELTPEEAAAVSGGALALLAKGIIAGGRMDPYLTGSLSTKLTNPAAGLDAGGLATLGGMTGMV